MSEPSFATTSLKLFSACTPYGHCDITKSSTGTRVAGGGEALDGAGGGRLRREAPPSSSSASADASSLALQSRIASQVPSPPTARSAPSPTRPYLSASLRRGGCAGA